MSGQVKVLAVWLLNPLIGRKVIVSRLYNMGWHICPFPGLKGLATGQIPQ